MKVCGPCRASIRALPFPSSEPDGGGTAKESAEKAVNMALALSRSPL